MSINPAQNVILKIGVEKVAEVTGKHISRVYRWTYDKRQGGTGGLIPMPSAVKLLAAFPKQLNPSDFFPGGAI